MPCQKDQIGMNWSLVHSIGTMKATGGVKFMRKKLFKEHLHQLILLLLVRFFHGTWHSSQLDDSLFRSIYLGQFSHNFCFFPAPPTEAPNITGFKLSYSIHEIVDTLCTPPLAKPHPKLEWLINDEPAPIEFTSKVNESSLRLHFPLQVQHLQSKKSKFSLRCVASFKFNQSLYETSILKNSSLSLSNHSGTKLIIYGLKNFFQVGDLLKLTCHYAGDDLVHMYWQVNYRKLPPVFTVKYAKPQFLGMALTIQPWHLDHLGKVHVKCVAGKIFKLVRGNRKDGIQSNKVTLALLIVLPYSVMNIIYSR